jgi:hypothetical protein
MATLLVTDVPTGQQLDRVTLADGGLQYATGAAQELFAGALAAGLDPAEAFAERAGWSNGYIRISQPLDPDRLPPIPGLREQVEGSLTAAFNPRQARDEDGRWTDGVASGKGAFEALDPHDAVAGRIADPAVAGRLNDAVAAYGGNQYKHMNTALRRGGEGLYPGEKQFVRSLDAGLAASPLPEDTEVWRGLDGSRVFGPQWLAGSLVGAEWSDASFNSTTANPAVAEDFAGGTAPVLMRFRVPQGAGALRIGKWGKGGYGKEAEILLGRDNRYRVVADHGVVKGKRRIDVEVIPQTPRVVA